MFFNLFEKGKKRGGVKADFAAMLNASIQVSHHGLQLHPLWRIPAAAVSY